MLTGLNLSVFAQQIQISANKETLSDVLVQLRDNYSLSFSFNDAELRKYTVTLDRQFENTGKALDFLLKDFPLTYDKTGDVYVIYTQKQKSPAKKVNFFLTGRIVERKSLEPLPYSSLVINGKGSITDENGFFQHRSSDSVFHVQASHLGYYKIDTLLVPGEKHLLKLIPAIEKLEEVVITDRLLETFLYVEDQAGVLRMNHKITRFLPGSSNNSVFNLLRLQSGITASAEALENLIVWGSYEGQSRIIFDEILLFGLTNFNDNIGTVNPYVVKDIKLMKAAYEALYGNCVGGIAEITGKVGNQNKLSMDLSLNNYTLNSMLETPVGD
ncbi:MAG: TonB-dependent receptor, partial [Bacteroidota bacterium]